MQFSREITPLSQPVKRTLPPQIYNIHTKAVIPKLLSPQEMNIAFFCEPKLKVQREVDQIADREWENPTSM